MNGAEREVAVDQFTRIYDREEFVALAGTMNIEALSTVLGALSLTVPVADVRAAPAPSTSVVVEFQSAPGPADRAAVDAAVATFNIVEPVEGPLAFNSFAASTTTSNTHQTKIDQTTPVLKEGTYSVQWNCSIGMSPPGASSGIEAKIRLERSDGEALEQTDAWDLGPKHAYNGSTSIHVSEGQTIRCRLTFARLGAAGVAEISGARITVDKVA